MSTKAIREALEDMEQHGIGPQSRLAAVALEELEAIEAAARDWCDVDGLLGPGRMARIDDLMRSIAEVPKSQ